MRTESGIIISSVFEIRKGLCVVAGSAHHQLWVDEATLFFPNDVLISVVLARKLCKL